MCNYDFKTISKKCAAVVCYFFLLFSISSQFALGQGLENEKFAVQQMIERGQPHKAIEKIANLITSTPNDASLQYYLGIAQLMHGETQNALASFEKGIKMNDKDALNYVGKGHVKLIE